MPRAFSNGQTCLPRPPSPEELSVPDAIKRLTIVARDLLLGLMEYSELTDEQVSLLYTAVVKEYFLTMDVFELHHLEVPDLKSFPDKLRDALESVLEKANSVDPTTIIHHSAPSLPSSFSSSTSTFIQPYDDDDEEEEETNERQKENEILHESWTPSTSPTLSSSLDKGVEVSAEEINSLLTQLIQQLQSVYKSSFASTHASSLSLSPSTSTTFFSSHSTPTTYAQLSPSPKKFTFTSSSRTTSSLSLPSSGSSKANLSHLLNTSKSRSFSSETSPSPYLFLEWSKHVKKIKFLYEKLDFSYLYHLFYTHFQCIPHSHSKLPLPKLYVYDFPSHIFYELEDVTELSCGSYLRMEPMTLSPIRIHSSVLDTSLIHAKHPLRAVNHLKKELLQLKEEVLEFQLDHQQWFKDLKDQWSDQLIGFQSKMHTLDLNSLLHIPSKEKSIVSLDLTASFLPALSGHFELTSKAHQLYLISEQVRYDLCERHLLPNALWLDYLSNEFKNLETQCDQLETDIHSAQQTLSPLISEHVHDVLQQQEKIKEAKVALMETQHLLKTMKEVQLKLERALELAQEQPWPKPTFHFSPSSHSSTETPMNLSSLSNASSTFLAKGLPLEVLDELQTVPMDSEHRVALMQAFEQVRRYQQSQLKKRNESLLVKELATKTQRTFPLEVLNTIEAKRKKQTQLLLKMIWDSKKETLRYHDEGIGVTDECKS